MGALDMGHIHQAAQLQMLCLHHTKIPRQRITCEAVISVHNMMDEAQLLPPEPQRPFARVVSLWELGQCTYGRRACVADGVSACPCFGKLWLVTVARTCAGGACPVRGALPFPSLPSVARATLLADEFATLKPVGWALHDMCWAPIVSHVANSNSRLPTPFKASRSGWWHAEPQPPSLLSPSQSCSLHGSTHWGCPKA